MIEKKYKCFVIMPFSKSSESHTQEYWTNQFENFLKPEIEKIPNLEVHRSEELRSDIIKEIIKDLYLSDIVIADLTDHNPNVFWELGVRQSSKFGTITIAEYGTDLPFDVSTKSTLFYYPKDTMKNEKFLQNLKNAIIDVINYPDKPDSNVLEITLKLKEEELIPDLFESLKEETYTKQEQKMEIFLDPNIHSYYILIGFIVVPQNISNQIFDMNDSNDENFITTIHRIFNLGSPSGRIRPFHHYIRDFKFINGAFKSKYEYTSDNSYNLSEFDIFSNGNIIGDIIFRTQSGYEIVKNPSYEYDDYNEKEYRSSPFIHSKTFPYLVIMFLFLAKLLYKERFSGDFNLNLRILSNYKISTVIHEYVKLSNNDDFEFNKPINMLDLNEKDKFIEILYEVIRDFLRFFGYNLQRIKKYLKTFEEAIESYINLIFR